MIRTSDLSPRARDLLRSSVKPSTPADRARIKDALRARLGSTALPPAQPAALPLQSRSPVISRGVVGVALIGGALFLIGHHALHHAAPAPAQSPPSAAISSVPALPVAPVESVAVAPVSSAPVLESAAASFRPAPDRLAQEVALLERATSALRAGRAENALKILDDYQRRFPSGLLAPERAAARAQALCLLGRQNEAQVELGRLPASSTSAARAKRACEPTFKARH